MSLLLWLLHSGNVVCSVAWLDVVGIVGLSVCKIGWYLAPCRIERSVILPGEYHVDAGAAGERSAKAGWST